VGRSRLARELAGRRLDRGVIDDALDQVYKENDEDALIDRAIEKRARTRGPLDTKEDLKRLFDYLMRLGFQYDLIMGKLRGPGLHRRDTNEE
jgi:SOS response regulatory protein OraA/RecX